MSNVELEKEERGKSKSKRKMPGDFLSNVECRMSNVECRMSKLQAPSSKLKYQPYSATRSVTSRSARARV